MTLPSPDNTSISLDLCLKLSPLVMCLDEGGNILFCSERLSKHIGKESVGKSIFNLFLVEGPGKTYSQNRKISEQALGELFLLSSQDLQFALRGQIIEGMYDSQYVYIFLGSPWLSWLYDNLGEVSVNVKDFPASDSQLEYQLNLCSNKEMLSDLKKFSASLEQARAQAEIAGQAKTRFVRHISHEIRTPLNGVITSLKLLKDETEQQRRARLFEIASSSANALMDLINEVLDFSRIEDGVFASTQETFSLRAMLRDVEAGLSGKAAEKDMYLQFDIDHVLPSIITADKRSLQRILYNIVGNAIKYSKSDLVSTRLSLSNESESWFLTVEVEDYGVGIQEDELSHIFEPFWTSANKSSNEYSTGLGLSIVQEMIQKLDGRISVESMLGQGTRFKFSIPIEEPSSDDNVEIINSKAPPTDAKFIGNVLLVDDNSINLELAQILLRKTGLTITTASDGAEAVAAEKENSFDLIFMDIEMPVLNGTEATVQIRAGGRNSDIPIIALTANVSEDDIAFYLSKGMTDSLTKPVATEAMIELLARYLPYTLEDKLALEAASAMQQEDPGELMLDSDTLNNLLNDIGAENAERVINMYIDDTSKQMGTLVRYMQSGDRENTRKVAHRLASSSLSFGLNKLGNSLRQIEKFAKEDQAFDAIDADGLESLFADSKAALIKAFKSD